MIMIIMLLLLSLDVYYFLILYLQIIYFHLAQVGFMDPTRIYMLFSLWRYSDF